jgi:hypothetical protein
VIRKGDSRISVTSSTPNATISVPTTLGKRGKSDTHGPAGKPSTAQMPNPVTMPELPISSALLGENSDMPKARHAPQPHSEAIASSSRNT